MVEVDIIAAVTGSERLMSRITDKQYAMFVAVYTGQPVDMQQHRHVGLFFTTDPMRLATGKDKAREFFVHAQPLQMDYVVAVHDDYDPFDSQDLAHIIGVGMLSRVMSFDDVEFRLRQIDIPSCQDQPDFNSQIWTGLALEKLRNTGCIDEDQFEKAMDGMVQGIADATEEPEPVLI